MKDELGKRMKTFYENRTRWFLPRRTYTIIRIDGKAFHTYTKGLERPFDKDFVDDMNETAKYLCKNIQGAKLAYVQSDEISILVTDFDKLGTDAWFDGNVQKIVSVSASYATAKFNYLRTKRFAEISGFADEVWIDFSKCKLATFDSRTYTIPSATEVGNYFVWRQKDCVRNSISSVAQTYFSTKELFGKTTNEMQEMLFNEKGVNWNKYDPTLKRGRLIVKEEYNLGTDEKVKRTRWVVATPETFVIKNDMDFVKGSLNNLIPKHE